LKPWFYYQLKGVFNAKLRTIDFCSTSSQKEGKADYKVAASEKKRKTVFAHA